MKLTTSRQSRDGDPPQPTSHRAMPAKKSPSPRVSRWTSVLIATLALNPGPVVHSSSASLDLARFRGQVVVVDFWASWCKPCRQSIPWLNALRERYGPQGLTIIGVNVDAERTDAEKFQREVPIAFEVLYDPAGKLAAQFGVQGMPSTFIFDREGKLVRTLLGFRANHSGEHEAAIQDLLKGKSTS
ncbi:MAG TPA: TlpA disulfide reductase family protein [Steroidobacteraceae bacterium]|nr:TlpA disulfide reductase family protein [Steroidobacteraceae bacterium]